MDVQVHSWLLNSILYWERILTIVPERDIAHGSPALEPLVERQWLAPLAIDRNERRAAVRKASLQTLHLLDSGALIPERVPIGPLRHADAQIHEWVDADKIDRGLWPYLLAKKIAIRDAKDYWCYHIDKHVFEVHMSLLATHLARASNLPLVTDNNDIADLAEDLAVRIREEAAPPRKRRLFRTPKPVESSPDPRDYVARISIQVAGIRPDTPVAKVVAFREKHLAELERFRSAVAKLSADIAASGIAGREEMEAAAREAFLHDVRPSVVELDKALRLQRIESTQLALSGAMLTSMPSWLVQMPHFLQSTTQPLAVAAMEGLTLSAVAIKHEKNRRQLLRESPFAYVLAARQSLGGRRPPKIETILSAMESGMSLEREREMLQW
ncbi:hypothetical protein [Catenulispora yoronensis]